MERATALQIRQSLELADMLAKKIGVRFVPIPVFNEEDYNKCMLILSNRLDKLADMCEENN